MSHDPGRLAAILARLPPDDAAYLSTRLLQPWERRQRRLEARDAAVLEAFAAVPTLQPTPAARLIATELARYLASAWRIERDRDLAITGDALRATVARIARANDGQPIGYRQLLNIRAGVRR